MPWQQQVADVALEVNADGSYFYRTVIITVQRQSGKTTLLGPVNLHRCLTVQDARAWLTAQRRQDARDTWLDIATRAGRSPLGSLMSTRRSNGSEALTFPATGGTFRIFAPTEDALHGKTNHLVAVDECWAFDAPQGLALEQAILPTFTVTGGQLWLVSTAGHADSAWLRSYVERGRAAVEAGRTDGVAYFEWSLADDDVDEVAGGLADDASSAARQRAFDLVLAAHPAAGLTLRLDALEQAADAMSPGDFLRAYANRWTRTADAVFAAHLWSACRAPAWPVPEPGTVALAFDVAVDRSDAAIAAGWRATPDGPLRVDLVEHRPGGGWLAGRLAELATRWRAPVAADPFGPAGDIVDELRRAGVEIIEIKARDYAAACAAFLAAVTDGRLQHPGSPGLDAAVAAAATRRLGDAWAWSRRSSAASISPLIAATLAGWTFDHRPEPEPAPLIYARRRRY